MNASGSVLLDTTTVVAHFRQDLELADKLKQCSLYLPPLSTVGRSRLTCTAQEHQSRIRADGLRPADLVDRLPARWRSSSFGPKRVGGLDGSGPGGRQGRRGGGEGKQERHADDQ